jgi:UDP-N-acetylmuramoyl-L-alanyl-D-glutamate--2,6-diaminopimelate ligase
MSVAAVSRRTTMPSKPENLPAKNLRALLAGLADVPASSVEVTDMTLDSREVRPGSVFVALPGTRTHGIGFSAQAVSAGARAILWEPTAGVAAPRVADSVALVAIPELTRLLGSIADRFFDSPSQSVGVIGVTGTNGKTTTAHVTAAALQQLGHVSAYAGTIGYGRIDALRAVTHTTHDAITVHRQLAELRAAGTRFLGMEVSSHALDQHRVGGVRFDTAVFTNLTRDHLDYHGTVEAYGGAKARLLAWPGLRHAVVNIDDPFGRELAQKHVTAERVTLCSRSADDSSINSPLVIRGGARRVIARKAVATAAGLDIEIDGSWGTVRLRSRFIGDFNVDNLLVVLATLLGMDVPLHEAVAALEQCSAPPGRMETVNVPGKPLAIIDYAHTPDALEKALLAVRKHRSGTLTCVFGCGGDRDSGKRPLMGAIAERLADRIVITDDNPRTESGDAVIADIVKGLRRPERAVIERDRAAAIARAIHDSAIGDVVLIAGKGHEDYQIVGAERRHFSDREVALAALEGPP